MDSLIRALPARLGAKVKRLMTETELKRENQVHVETGGRSQENSGLARKRFETYSLAGRAGTLASWGMRRLETFAVFSA